jgi:hypothetical protein
MTAETAGEDLVRVEPFANILVTLQKGDTHTELGQALHELVARVNETGKKGTVTLTLTVVQSKEWGRIQIEDKVTVKLPERDRYASIYFVDESGNLTRKDPHQMELPIGPRRVANDE